MRSRRVPPPPAPLSLPHIRARCKTEPGDPFSGLAGSFFCGLCSAADPFHIVGLFAATLPTAEGAVQLALEELSSTLHGAQVLILGFGRVGRLTAHRMAALGARVTVAAREYGELAWAAAYGCGTVGLEDLNWELGAFSLIVNTIPAPVLDEKRLAWVNPDAYLLDLASAPGGIDRTAARARGLRVTQAPGLPGRTAPVTAAAAIRDAVYHILREEEALRHG